MCQNNGVRYNCIGMVFLAVFQEFVTDTYPLARTTWCDRTTTDRLVFTHFFKMPGCCVPGCGNEDKTRMPFHRLPRNEKLRNLWLEKIKNPKLFDKLETTLRHMQVCSVHFEDKQYRTVNRQKLNIGAYPALFLPDLNVREFVKGAVPSLFNNDTTANSKECPKPVESNDLETKSDKIVEEPEVTPAPILLVSSFADYKEEVLTTSHKQPDTDCDLLKKRIVHSPQCPRKCKVEDLESLMQRERNWNQVMNENCALQKKVNILQSENRRLDRRVRSMKILLRHYKNMHTRSNTS